ncbi:NUDIX domain-containing protein [Actinomadura alba]|uniref:NUDIX domain-containing protein n=1 Tax=Actinomadura alba TaxID=406431 RepID=A0ABR7LP65_9ACTN|nr:NUDIX domain-containing protein [Actinomadura alba]MBC6466640.1 NUDIX domain-containing protein [Actinomadura alba]
MTDHDLDQRLRDDADRDGIQKLVVGAVIHHQGLVLILRRSATDKFLPGIEKLPSGGVDDGEDLLTALARELAEEIGRTGPLTVDPDFVASFDYISGSGRKARQYTFAVPHDGRPLVLSEEHDSHRWLDPTHLADSDLTEETAQTIRDWALIQGTMGGLISGA